MWLPIVNDPAWFGSSYQKRSPIRILLNWSPTRHLNVGPTMASPSFLSSNPPMYKSMFSIAPYNYCNLGTNCNFESINKSLQSKLDVYWKSRYWIHILDILPRAMLRSRQIVSMIWYYEVHKAVSISHRVPAHDHALAVRLMQLDPFRYLMYCLGTSAA